MIKNITVDIGNGAVSEAPKTFEIIFQMSDGVSPTIVSLWLSSDMTKKEFVKTMLDFVSKLVYRWDF